MSTQHRNPRPGQPGYEAPSARIAKVRRLFESGASEATIVEWCRNVHPGTSDGSVPAKIWTIGEAKAREYIQIAKEQTYDEDADDKSSKRSVNRSRTLRLLHAALSRNEIGNALKAQHMLNMIDQSYDESYGSPNTGTVSSEESARSIDHAAKTLALARARGVAPLPRPVIDVGDATPPDEESDDDATAAAGEN